MDGLFLSLMLALCLIVAEINNPYFITPAEIMYEKWIDAMDVLR